MKFSELRLGNWVRHKHMDENGVVVAITPQLIQIRIPADNNEIWGLREDECEFIPLDNDILKDFGFDTEKQGWPELIIDDVQGSEVRIAISGGACVIEQYSREDGISFATAVQLYNETPENDREGLVWGSFVGRDSTVVFEDIPYLHQLQNRYYDITHKEIPSIYDSTPSTEPTGDKE